MAFRAHDRFHLLVGREIKQTLNAGGCGDLTRNGAGLAMLNLGNGEVDVFFGKRTLDQEYWGVKHIVVKKKGVQVIQMSQLHISLHIPQHNAGGNPQLLIILHQQLHIPLQQSLYVVRIFIVYHIIAHRPKNRAIGTGKGIGKRGLRVIARVGIAFSLTPFLNGQPVAGWAIEGVVAVGEGGRYAMRAYCRAEKFPQQILLALQFYQQFPGLVGCQGGRSADDGNTDASAAPAVEAGFKTIYGVPQVEELRDRVAIKISRIAEIKQVAFFVVGWTTNGKPFGGRVDGLILRRQKAGFGVDGVFDVAFYRKGLFAMAALRAGRVLYFFAVGGCREGVAVMPSNNVVAHFFQFGFVRDIFKGVENCLYANDTLISVVERQVECIWTQILSPLYIEDNTKFGKSQICGSIFGKILQRKIHGGKGGNNISNNMENKKMRFGGELPGPGVRASQRALTPRIDTGVSI